VAKVKAAIDSVQYSPYQPVPVAEGVSTATVLAIDENQSLLPGVVVQAEPVRYYPYGETTANIVGMSARSPQPSTPRPRTTSAAPASTATGAFR